MAVVVRILGGVMALAGLVMAATVGLQYWQVTYGPPATRLEVLWKQDLEKLKAAKQLPAAWNDIREVQLIPTTDNAKFWLKQVQVPIPVKSTGQHKLEVLLISWEEERAQGVIMQYNLVDLKTKNMVWELGRTFVLAGEERSAVADANAGTATLPPGPTPPKNN